MTDEEIFKKNILDFNGQLAPSAIQTENLEKLKGFTPDAIVLVGMGGSGTPGNILQNLTEYANIHIPVISWKDFGLPNLPSSIKRPLYVFISFSGNTRETLTGFYQAIAAPTPSGRGSDRIVGVVSGGGTLLTEAKKQNIPLATFEIGTLQPRQGYGLTFSAVLPILGAVTGNKVSDMSEVIKPAESEDQGKSIAEKIAHTLPFIYTSTKLSHIGQIFKISINESGKLPASANVFPEMNHNELSIFETKPKNVIALFITTKDEHKKLEKEINIIKQILTEYETPLEIIEIAGEDTLQVTYNAIVLAQWVGYYVATMRGLNPLSIKTVNRIKELTK